MNINNKISNGQIRGLVVSTIVGVGVLSLPSTIVNIMGLNGWIGITISGLLMMVVLFLMCKIFNLYPDMEYFQIGEKVLGTLGFGIAQTFMLIYFVFSSALICRVLGEVLKGFLLPTTPIEITIVAFVLVTAYLARSEVQIIARISYFSYLLIIIFTIFIVLISIPNAEFINLLPVFQMKPKELPAGVKDAIFSFTGFEVLLFAIPNAKEKSKAAKAGLSGLLIVILVYLSITVMAISQFGIEQLKREAWPTLALIKEIDLPGLFLENLDGIVMAFWVFFAFSSLAVSMHIGSRILGYFFKTEHHQVFPISLLPIILFIALIPKNVIELTKKMGAIFDILALIAVIIIPLLILAMGHIRKRREIN